jgi:hypothetical protein
MKKFILKSIIVMMVALCYQVANAQNVVSTISTADFNACKEYLQQHPMDTIVNGAVKVFLYNGKVVRTGNEAKSVAKVVPEAERVERSGNVTNVKYVDGSSTTFTRTTSDKVSYSDKVAVVNGQKLAMKPGHRDVELNLRHTVYGSVLAGGMYVFDDHEFQPMGTLKLGYESCHFLFEMDGSYSRMEYTNTAEASGHYNSFSAYLGAGWKFWQDNRYRSYLSVGGSAGYAYQRTDKEAADVFSDNYGFAAKGWVRGNISLNNRLGLLIEGGYNLLPKVYHQEDQDHQDFGHGGAYLQIGLNYRFYR